MPPKFVPKHKRAAVAAERAAAAEAAAAGGAGEAESEAAAAIKALEAAGSAEAAKSASATARSATGILVSEKRARDIAIDSFSLSLHSKILVEDTRIELNWGNRYGLIGRSSCGKSTFLQCLADRDVPIPEHIDTYLLREEAAPTELSALEYVVASATKEVARLEALAEALLEEYGPDCEALEKVYDRQTALDPATFESRASSILVGLGFNSTTIHKKTKDMSGGWRMRVALAHALFVSPSLLLLDEPTNHLDLPACVWLENYLSTYPNILLVISHSQDFLDGVCTHTMVMQRKKLKTWGGSYSTYVKTREEQDSNQLTLYKKQQEEIAHIKAFIASCGTYANLVRQAQSRQKVLDKMIADGLIEMPYADPTFRFRFPETGKLPPPLISFSDVAFSYSGKKEDYLYKDLSFGIDCDSRICLVGPNGAGKSTLVKLMVGELAPCEGRVDIKSGVSIGRFHQHSTDILDLELSPLDYIARRFAERYPDRKLQDWRSAVGQWGISSEYQTQVMKTLSAGMLTRVALCELAQRQPHVLLFDEPTNAADMEMIDSMALAIKAFEGGVVVISHDFRLLSQIGGEVWVVENGVRKFDGDIRAYKTALSKAMSAGISGAEAEKTVGKGGKSASTKGAAAGGAGAGAKPAAGGAGKGKFG